MRAAPSSTTTSSPLAATTAARGEVARTTTGSRRGPFPSRARLRSSERHQISVRSVTPCRRATALAFPVAASSATGPAHQSAVCFMRALNRETPRRARRRCPYGYVPISTEDFSTLNLCLDDAIAGAVEEFAKQREGSIRDENTERLGVLAHELRNLLNTALMSFESIRTGVVALNGSTSLVLGRSLLGLRDLIDRSLADVRLDAGMQNIERVGVAEVIEEIDITASVQAQARHQHFTINAGERNVIVRADRQILIAAVANLVQNAFKFTPKDGKVLLTTSTTSERVLIEVEDECGGLPPGRAEELFHPFSQRGGDRSGLGLGLSICLKTVEAIDGELRVRNIPGKGCVFTIDLPKQPPPPIPIGIRKPTVDGSPSSSSPGKTTGTKVPKARAV